MASDNVGNSIVCISEIIVYITPHNMSMYNDTSDYII